jgi:hypothetical protein
VLSIKILKQACKSWISGKESAIYRKWNSTSKIMEIISFTEQ